MSALAEKICAAREFRSLHPQLSFTQVGYGAASAAVESDYVRLVTVASSRQPDGEEETHVCLCCSEIVFRRTHR